MNKKTVAILVSTLILTFAFSVAAQQPTKVPRIGYLSAGSASSQASRVEVFKQGLRELGYIEAAIRALKQATKTIPIVVGVTGDLVVTGHAATLARPGGNVTGFVDTSPDLSGKRMELLKEILPKASRIAVLWNAANPVKVLDFKETATAALALGLKLQSLEVRASEDFEIKFKAATTQRAGALVVLQDALTTANTRSIVDFAAKSRLPAMYGSTEVVDVGGLMSYAANLPDLFRRAAMYVDKILKGSSPADLPIEQPTRFEFIINLKAAKQIGLTIPPNVLVRADRVIK